ncbi:MAG: DegT/DnrJ/EryC1/StrS family aminotransferase [Planctomycetota bacterium]|jgi:L-glutamine:2-deoxy-scyllo-inosose/3-amino-2,3-dideoxy-scyllo-inosose aminotransferase
MSKLAVNGGTPLRDAKANPWPKWPVWDEKEEKGLLEVLAGGVWSYNGPKELEFNKAFAEFTGAEYALSVANGTVSLQLALEACGIGLGDEVIVPGLTWQATAAAALDVNAVPILVDVSEDNWCIDPDAVEEAITPRTRAIIPVHLYGGFADMDAVMEVAGRHNLRVIEDCAHKHGGEWKGKKVGSIGDAGSFSFQLSKLMTAGEGGALTTSDSQLFEKLDALRNCGRRPESEQCGDKGAGHYGSEGDFIQSGNYRITDFQAAVLIESLKRLPEQNAIRHEKAQFKGLDVAKFREAMARELGCDVEASYEPLDACSLYTPHTKPCRHKLSEEHWRQIDPARFSLPVCHRIYREESVCFHHTILMGTKADMDFLGRAIEKVYENAEELL